MKIDSMTWTPDGDEALLDIRIRVPGRELFRNMQQLEAIMSTVRIVCHHADLPAIPNPEDITP